MKVKVGNWGEVEVRDTTWSSVLLDTTGVRALAECSWRNWSVFIGQQETSLTLEAIRKVVLENLKVFSDSENNLEIT